jgi:hypothetical protein
MPAHAHRIYGGIIDIYPVKQQVSFKAERPDQVVHAVDASENRAFAAARRADKTGDVIFFDIDIAVPDREEIPVIQFLDFALDGHLALVGFGGGGFPGLSCFPFECHEVSP